MWRLILIPFSIMYFLIITIPRILYRLHIFRRHRIQSKVISIGNITWGGTGKTPAVLCILEILLSRARKVGILIRGYGNDEQGLFKRLAHGIPVLVGKDRVRSGVEAIAKHSVDTLLLDDGFQYRRLKRDLDIVCIDATNPFGNGCLIPCGLMREGLGALKRADIFLITKVDLVKDQRGLEYLEKRLRRINPGALTVKSIHKVQHLYKLSDDQLVDIGLLKDKDIVLVSAIGNPQSFEKIILQIGLKVKRHFIFRDHHWYTKKDLRAIGDYCIKQSIDTIITTEKDAVKLRTTNYELRTMNYLVLSIKLEIIENEERFNNRLFRIYSS